VPLVAALLKKKHKRHQTQNLFAAASPPLRAVASDLLLVACALVLPSPLLCWMDRTPAAVWPSSSFRFASSSLWSCLISPPLLAAVIGFSNLRLDPCRWAALGSPPRTHASLLAQRSFLECTLSRGGAAGSSTAGGEDDGFGLQENRNKQCQIPSLKFFDQLRAAVETC
jgi:hypothetical protein